MHNVPFALRKPMVAIGQSIKDGPQGLIQMCPDEFSELKEYLSYIHPLVKIVIDYASSDDVLVDWVSRVVFAIRGPLPTY
jgi:hypothetical protein